MTVINIKEKKMKNKFQEVEKMIDAVITKANAVKESLKENKYHLDNYKKILKKDVDNIMCIDVQERLVAEEFALFLENEAIFIRENPDLDFINMSKLMHIINEEIINTTNYFMELLEAHQERCLAKEFED